MSLLVRFIMSNNLGPQQLSLTNKRTAPMEPSPKSQSESFESVRAKLRESLAASLALVSQTQNKTLAVEKSNQTEVASTPSQVHVDSLQAESTSTSVDASSCHTPGRPSETSISNIYESNQNRDNGSQTTSYENFINGHKHDGQEFEPKHVSLEDEAMFSTNFIIKDELLQGHGLCWASDLELGGEMAENREAKRPKLTPEDNAGLEIEQALPSPQALAIKIEAELFKFFGGVNKKYKEKARSLLFNLKDRSNPELRERVLSGEIPPERLCSMTTEELASKELSQWRIAKAEELAQMVVLPDTEVDIRRLVKKTHKGEFQVEVERDDSVSVEVALETSSLAQISARTTSAAAQVPSEPTETEAQISSKSNETGASEGATAPEKSVDSGDQSFQSNVITISHDAADFMQGFMEDELKDAEFLPPIVSLDEFMESLDSEPPFENLQQETGKDNSVSVEINSNISGSKLDSLKVGSTDPLDSVSDKPNRMDVKSTKPNSNLTDSEGTLIDGNLRDAKYTRTDSDLKSSDIRIASETSHLVSGNKGEHVWEGLLQLNVSSIATVTGFFKSGEKTSAKDWPSFLEIKGRVRLDAFEKFLQELPLSRSRAIMVLHFCWKDGSPESGHLHLSEVADSYVADERVGFAEPAPAVELYLCPPHVKMVEILGRHLPKDHTKTLNAIENGLIGIVVWRKPHVSISPKMSSYQRQNSRKQQFNSKRLQERDGNLKQSHPPLPTGPVPSNPNPPDDDDDDDDIGDIPPGFGPTAARDDDDLPEFDFVKNTKPLASQFQGLPQGSGTSQIRPPIRAPPRQMQQMRELVHKYGQGKPTTNLANQQSGQCFETEPWNEEDDIPEWQPVQDSKPLPPPPPPPIHGFQQQVVPSHLLNQQLASSGPLPTMPLQALQAQGMHGNVQPPWQSGPWRAPPYGAQGTLEVGTQGNGLMQPCHFGGPPADGQPYRTPGVRAAQNGMDRRPDIQRSRGV